MPDDATPTHMMTQAELDTMTEEQAAELGRQTLSQMRVELGAEDEAEPVCIIQWGRDAFREGEPALWTGQTMSTNPHKRGIKGFYAVVCYEDSGPYYVDMNLPRYPHGKKPPRWLNRRVIEQVRDEKGAMVDGPVRYERPEDRKLWLEFIPRSRCRKALKVIA